jgi:hypothetical protein
VIGRERWCATDRKRKQTRVTLSGCGGQYRNEGAEHGHHIVVTIGGSVSVVELGCSVDNNTRMQRKLSEFDGRSGRREGEGSREQTARDTVAAIEGFRVARRKVLVPYTAAPGNGERRLGDRNAESAL